MADRTLTSANAVLSLTAAGVYAAPVRIQGFSTERMFNADGIDFTEFQMGVDGFAGAGYTPNPVPFTLSLMANSPSRDVMNNIIRYMQQTRDVVLIGLTLDIPATQESFSYLRGVLQNGSVIPSAAKVLQPIDYRFMFEKLIPTVL